MKYNSEKGRLETPYVEFNYTDDGDGGTNAKIEGGLTEGGTAITATTLNGTNIVTKSGGAVLNDHLINSMEFSEPGTDGSITLTIKAITADKEYTATFKQADTIYYKTNATKTIKVEPYIASSIGKSMRAYGYNYNGDKIETLFASFSLQDPVVGSSNTYSDGYVEVKYSGTVVGRVGVGSVYSAGLTAGEASGKAAVVVDDIERYTSARSADYTYYNNDKISYTSNGTKYIYVKASANNGSSRQIRIAIEVNVSSSTA